MKYGVIVVGVLALMAMSPDDAPIVGDYVEARNCDVWTGPCFSNSEMNLRGDKAIVAWAVRKGANLDGLKIVAVLRSESTFHTSVEGKVKALVFVDEAATSSQADALLALARQMAPKYLSDVLKVERRSIQFSREGFDASVSVGSEVRLKTKEFCMCIDRICCNEEQAYPPLSGSVKVDCAKTVEHAYQGSGFGGLKWSDPNARSAMVGSFSR